MLIASFSTDYLEAGEKQDKEGIINQREEEPSVLPPEVGIEKEEKKTPLIVARMTMVPPESLRIVKIKKAISTAAIEEDGWLIKRAY